MSFFILLIIFFFGLVIGSFLNAAIYRLHTGESISRGRSKCPQCRHALAAKDLIPVASFIFLGGRCRYCHKKISWQYPLVELATGLLFVLAYIIESSNYRLPTTDYRLLILLLRDFFALSALMIIFVSDWLYLTIPDEVVLPAIIIIFFLNLLLGISWIALVLGLLVGGGFFALQYVLSKGVWVGGGDLRLGVLIGVLVGWPFILAALFIAYLAGALVALILLAVKKATPKTQIPFGIFLAPAALVILFWGNNLVSWYLNLL
jgi:prepilin signal peptidase PulO-like enzyme (type II secretory pathway)